MKCRDYDLEVGKRDIDDRKKVKLAGRLINPSKRSDALLFVAAGFNSPHEPYLEYFGEVLGKEFNVYVTELRGRGKITSGDDLRRDFQQVEEQARDIAETDKVVHIGHSMGMAVTMGAKAEYGITSRGLYGVCAYPNFGDTRGSYFTKKAVDLASLFDRGPLIRLDKAGEIEDHLRFVVGGNDWVLRTYDPKVLEKIVSFFKGYPNSTVGVYPQMNHCFNFKQKDWTPFNRDDPDVLVGDVREFVSGLDFS